MPVGSRNEFQKSYVSQQRYTAARLPPPSKKTQQTIEFAFENRRILKTSQNKMKILSKNSSVFSPVDRSSPPVPKVKNLKTNASNFFTREKSPTMNFSATNIQPSRCSSSNNTRASLKMNVQKRKYNFKRRSIESLKNKNVN